MNSSANSFPKPVSHAQIDVVLGLFKRANTNFRLIGGSACIKLGSTRVTFDVDVVLHCGNDIEYQDIIKSLMTASNNKLQHHGGRKYSLDGIEIEIIPTILSPSYSKLFNTPELDPTAILKAKLQAILDRNNPAKLETDMSDIKFLLEVLQTRHITFSFRLTDPIGPTYHEALYKAYLRRFPGDQGLVQEVVHIPDLHLLTAPTNARPAQRGFRRFIHRFI